jgi:AcrR family transcriptional regulator
MSSGTLTRGMARPKDQEARRAELAEAAMHVLAERGPQAVSLKEVAERAGLHPASVLYYYPEFEDLLLDALRRGMDRFYSRRREATEGIADARERLVATIRAGIPTDRDDRDVRLAWNAISFELRDQTLADYDHMYVDRQIDLYVSALELGVAQGHFTLADDVRTVASNLLALEDYHGLRFLLGWLDTYEEAAGLVLAYARTATECELDGDGSPAGRASHAPQSD